jgi:hypothetical protein
MRKAGIFVISAVLAISLIGCSGKTDEPNGEPSAPPPSFSAGESPEPPTQGKEETAATEAEEAVGSALSEQSETAAAEAGKQQSGNQPGGGGNGNTSTPSPQTATPQPAPQPKVETPTAAPSPEPAPSAPTPPKTAYDAPYDTAAIIADARAYGEGIGMTWSEPLATGNCSWEAPGATSPTLSGERLKTAIQGRIARIKRLQEDNGYRPGEYHFKVLFEPQGDGEYTIYFLMG